MKDEMLVYSFPPSLIRLISNVYKTVINFDEKLKTKHFAFVSFFLLFFFLFVLLISFSFLLLAFAFLVLHSHAILSTFRQIDFGHNKIRFTDFPK